MANPKNNGNSSTPLPKFDIGDFDGNFLNPNVVNAISKLVDPGNDAQELSMRVRFWDIDYKTAWCCLLDLADHFKDEQFKNLLKNMVAGDTSVDGYSRDQLIKAIIGQNYQEKKGGFIEKLKSGLGMGEEKKE